MNFLDVPIAQGDTIEGIAATHLGDPSRWPELASLNRLRYPYLSDDPRERSGTVLGQSQIRANPHSANAGDTGAALQTTNGVLAGEFVVALAADLPARLNQTALLLNFKSAAGPNWDLLPILGMIHPSGADAAVLAEYGTAWVATAGPPPLLVLQQGTHQFWAPGTEVTIHQNPAEAQSRVLGTGDFIRVPVSAPQGEALSLPSDFRDLLGIDLALSPQGLLSLDAGGDLATVSGIANLQQALRNRLRTEPGELILHPDYGNALIGQIGHVAPETLTIANAAARQAVAADPRIAGITNSSASQVADVLQVSVTARVQSVPELITVAAQLRTGGI